MESQQGSVLDLPDAALLSVLQRLDWLSVVGLSLTSHAAARRLSAVANLWRDLALSVLDLGAESDLRAQQQSATVNGTDEAADSTQTYATASHMAPVGIGIIGTQPTHHHYHQAPSGDVRAPAPAEPPLARPLAAASSERHRQALLRFASFSRWHHHSSIRLARLAGAPPSLQSVRDGAAWQLPESGPARQLMVRVSGPAARVFALTPWELACLRACDGSDIRVEGADLRCFSVPRAPSGAAARLLVALALRGRPAAWLYLPAWAPTRLTWRQQQDQEQEQQQRRNNEQERRQEQQQQQEQREQRHGRRQGRQWGVTGGGEGSPTVPAPAGLLYVPEVWLLRGALVPSEPPHPQPRGAARDGVRGRRDGSGSGNSGSGGGGGGGAVGDGCADDGDGSTPAMLRALLRAFVAAGAERLRGVGVLSFVARRKASPETGTGTGIGTGVARDLSAMRAAGARVLDLAGILGDRPHPPLEAQPAPADPHRRRGPEPEPEPGPEPDASSPSPAAGSGSATGTGAGDAGGRSDLAAAAATSPQGAGAGGHGVANKGLEGREGLDPGWESGLERRLLQELRVAAAAGGGAAGGAGGAGSCGGSAAAAGAGAGAGVGRGGGGDVALSGALRGIVSRLPAACPGLQVLVLPAVLPRAGRAVRTTPTRGAGSKLTAPRLLQLLVPVLSELRMAMAARRPGEGPGLPRLQAVVMVVEPEAEAHEAVLRQLAAATLDRGTGLEESERGGE